MVKDFKNKVVGFSDTICYKCGTHFNWYNVSCPKCGTPAGWNEKDEQHVKDLIKRVGRFDL